MDDNKTITYKRHTITPLKKGVIVVRDGDGMPIYNARDVASARDFIDSRVRFWTSAPLPFQGQKRMLLKEFKEVIATLPDDVTIIDLFGGSGLLSRAAKDVKPNAKVVYNDFDGYSERLKQIDRTNIILERIRFAIDGFAKSHKLDDKTRAYILSYLIEEGKKKPIDIITIASNLLFSGKFVSDIKGLAKHGFYNNVVSKDYSCDGYLDGLEVVRCDYKELFNKYKGDDNAFFILDPPYLSTDTNSYNSYWRIRDYINIFKYLNQMRHFVYFTSEKSQLIELLKELSVIYGFADPLEGCSVKYHNNVINYASNFRDFIYYK